MIVTFVSLLYYLQSSRLHYWFVKRETWQTIVQIVCSCGQGSKLVSQISKWFPKWWLEAFNDYSIAVPRLKSFVIIYHPKYHICLKSSIFESSNLRQKSLCKIKVGLSPSKKICVICLIEGPLKMRNAFYFSLKALSVLKIFTFLSRLFGHVGKTTWLER